MTEPELSSLAAKGIRVVLDLGAGHVRSLEIEGDGRTLTPLHTAPWVDDPAIVNDESIPPNLRHLSGDFFCAPFGTSDLEPAPPHGWPANSRWQHVETKAITGGMSALYRLERRVMGAVVEKTSLCATGIPSSTKRTPSSAATAPYRLPTTPWCGFRPEGAYPFRPRHSPRLLPARLSPIRRGAGRALPIRRTSPILPECRWRTAPRPTLPAIHSPSGTRIW